MTGQLQQVGAFLFALVRVRGLLDGGDVAVDRFAEVVDHAHAQDLAEVQAAQLVLEGQSHQAQPPTVFGGAFRATGGGVRGAQDVFQAFGFAEEFEAVAQQFEGHGAGSATGETSLQG